MAGKAEGKKAERKFNDAGMNFLLLKSVEPSDSSEQRLCETPLQVRHTPLLKRYVPAAIQPRLNAGHNGHLADMREVSVLFVKCSNVNIFAKESGSAAEVRSAVTTLCLQSSPDSTHAITCAGYERRAAADAHDPVRHLLMGGLHQQVYRG
jgi:hypothetical protein